MALRINKINFSSFSLGSRLDNFLWLLLGLEALFICLTAIILIVCFDLNFTIVLLILLCNGISARLLLALGQFLEAHDTMEEAALWARIEPTRLSDIFAKANVIFTEGFYGFGLFYSLMAPLNKFFPTIYNTYCHYQDSDPYPILFIHGCLCNASYWYPLIAYINKRGQKRYIQTITLEPLNVSIVDYAKQVKEAVENIKRDVGCSKVFIVGHSMGGLVARTYVNLLGGASNVKKIITLGTPHKGTAISTTRIAKATKAKCIYEMTPGKEFLEILNNKEEATGSVPVTSIYSIHDTVIIPQTSSHLDISHFKNIALGGIGHFGLIFNKKIYQIISDELNST